MWRWRITLQEAEKIVKIKNVIDWNGLGRELKVDVLMLNRTEGNYQQKRTEVLKLWLKHCCSPQKGTLVKAVKKTVAYQSK